MLAAIGDTSEDVQALTVVGAVVVFSLTTPFAAIAPGAATLAAFAVPGD